MPISEDEWHKGKVQHDVKSLIVKFLESRKTNAFTEIEILDNLKQNSNESWTEHLNNSEQDVIFGNALDELIYNKTIKSKSIELKGSTPMMYYKFK